MCEVLKYLIKESELLIPPDNLENVHNMDHYTWQKFVDRIKGKNIILKIRNKSSKKKFLLFSNIYIICTRFYENYANGGVRN